MIAFAPDELYVAVDRRRRRLRMSWRDVSREAGVSPSTLTRLGQGKSPNVNGLVRLMDWMGIGEVRLFTEDVT